MNDTTRSSHMVRILLALVLSVTLAASIARAADAEHGGHGGAAAAPAEDHGGGGQGGGGEKLSPIPTPAQAIAPAVTTLIVFALLLAVLGKYAWAPIATGLKARE